MADFYSRTGLPKQLTWGFVGVLIFMMGDGLEQTWLSKYITEQGFSSPVLYSVYGIAVALSSWLSGVIAETFGVKRTMTAGMLIYLVGVACFAGIGIREMNFPILLATYAIKGLGYPLFAYTFLVWITYRVDKSSLSSAQGWFWFVFTGGLSVLGAYYGVFAVHHIGANATLWTAAAFAAVGGMFALWVNKAESVNAFVVETEVKEGSKFKELINGLAILGREPKVLMGGIVRIINTISMFAFVVLMPIYICRYGVTDTEWASIWGGIFTINIVFNLIFGIVGDKIGWRTTVGWFGGVGCAVTVLLFYYAPQLSTSFWFIFACGTLWSIMLAGYVPLSALVPSLVEKDKGAAVSVLNLGAGLATFVGPLLVKILEKKNVIDGTIDYDMVVWVMAGLYLLSAVMTYFIRPSK